MPLGAREQQLKDNQIPQGIYCEEIQVNGEKSGKLHGLLVRRHNHSAVTPIQLKEPRTILFYMQGKQKLAIVP